MEINEATFCLAKAHHHLVLAIQDQVESETQERLAQSQAFLGLDGESVTSRREYARAQNAGLYNERLESEARLAEAKQNYEYFKFIIETGIYPYVSYEQ